MGGITTVWGGDFKQNLPVLPNGTRAQIVYATLKYSRSLWPKSDNIFVLTAIPRLANELNDNFFQLLEQIGFLNPNGR